MFESKKGYFSYADFDEILSSEDWNGKKIEIDELINEGFFIGNKQGYFSFIHYSFIEYFVAVRLVNEINNSIFLNLKKRVLYEEVFEFISYTLESTNAYDEISKVLLEGSIDPIVRVNIIPPIRKRIPKSLIYPLIVAHFRDPNPLVRYVCGYTLPIFIEKYLNYFNSEGLGEKFMEYYELSKEKNTLIKSRTDIIKAMMNFENPDFYLLKEVDKESIEEVVRLPGTIEAYEKILSINRENRYVIEESIRILTFYSVTVNSKYIFKKSLIDLLSTRYYYSDDISIRKVTSWELSQLTS